MYHTLNQFISYIRVIRQCLLWGVFSGSHRVLKLELLRDGCH